MERRSQKLIESPYITETKTVTTHSYNKNYGDDRVCECGHSYYRHFDMGCKYCACHEFKENTRTLASLKPGEFIKLKDLTVTHAGCSSGPSWDKKFDFGEALVLKKTKQSVFITNGARTIQKILFSKNGSSRYFPTKVVVIKKPSVESGAYDVEREWVIPQHNRLKGYRYEDVCLAHPDLFNNKDVFAIMRNIIKKYDVKELYFEPETAGETTRMSYKIKAEQQKEVYNLLKLQIKVNDMLWLNNRWRKNN